MSVMRTNIECIDEVVLSTCLSFLFISCSCSLLLPLPLASKSILYQASSPSHLDPTRPTSCPTFLPARQPTQPSPSYSTTSPNLNLNTLRTLRQTRTSQTARKQSSPAARNPTSETQPPELPFLFSVRSPFFLSCLCPFPRSTNFPPTAIRQRGGSFVAVVKTCHPYSLACISARTVRFFALVA